MKGKGKNIPETGKKVVTCLSCGKKVKIGLISYGYGYIGICPVCKKLAYNSRE